MSAEDMQNMMSAVALSKKEIESFLSPPRLARLSTVRDDGRPHVVPVWYYYDGVNILVPTMKGSRKAKNIQKNPHVSIVIDIVEGNPEDVTYLNAKAVVIEGKAETRDDDNGSFARKMYERYVGRNSLSNPMVQYSINQPRYVIVIEPTKFVSWDLGKIANTKQ
jgi:PPOX class probable F420-dependent enzyme